MGNKPLMYANNNNNEGLQELGYAEGGGRGGDEGGSQAERDRLRLEQLGYSQVSRWDLWTIIAVFFLGGVLLTS